MMEPKQAEASDRLSSLPAELRDEILVRLDLRDAVRTSDIQVFQCTRHAHGFGDFLGRFAHAQNLNLHLPVNDFEIPYTLPFTFPNLKSLQLSMDFTEMHPVLFMFTLLRSSHNLENLKIKFDESVDQSIEGIWEFLNALWSDDMCANLQTVRMIDVNWLPKQISFMKLLLSKARLLRTLYVDKSPDVFDDPIIDLLQCKRASAQAHVLFKGLVHLVCIAECKIGSLE